MKISLNWLSDYVEIDRPAEEAAEILSNLGFPNEGIAYLDGDTVIDLEITSNRGDCLGHIGVARELAAATGAKLKLPAIDLDESKRNAADLVSVEVQSPQLCGRYTARVIEGVKIGLSPEWMVKRLEAVGLRSVNNVVDATNYAMMETGQPPHAFDYDKIAGHKIIVRNAKAGETLVSIDGTKCELKEDMLVIADPKGPVAIAGVMGGLNTEVSGDTTAILLEDAYFDPVTVRTTSRRLNLPSEASLRFEHIVDIENIDWASRRTAQLIIQVAGGKAAKGVVDVYLNKPKEKKVALRLGRLKKLLGMDIPDEKVIDILSMLQFKPERKGDIVGCVVPSWRNDVYREVDLIEEVARVYGYDKVPARQKIEIEVRAADAHQKLIRQVGSYLNSCGFYETINIGFVEESPAGLFVKEGENFLAVRDVSKKTANLLRRDLICSLIGVVKTNLNFKNTPCKVYEIADTFIPTQQNNLPIERAQLALACDGDFREIKGALEGLIKWLNSEIEVSFVPEDLVWAQVGAKIIVGGNQIGTAGIVSEKIRESFNFKGIDKVRLCAAQVDFERLSLLCKDEIRFTPLAKFPAIVRDLSILVDEEVKWLDIEQAIKGVRVGELEEIRFVGIYHGRGIPEGKKSVTFSLRFRDEDGTLTHSKVDNLQNDIVSRLNKAAGAVLRTI